MDIFPVFVALLLGLALGALVGVLWVRSRPERVETALDQAELMQGLDRLADQVRGLDEAGATWQARFAEQVTHMHRSTETLRRETQGLATALRRPQVRGQWGEMHLRRAVELAGLVDHCDFTEQVRVEGGAQRPDLVVHLAGDRQVVVDAKVPLEAFLDACDAEGEEQAAHLARQARHVRKHVDDLASKAYWSAVPDAGDFVVMFVPSEAFLFAALEADRGLLEHAAGRQVVVATPTTLIALLRTVALGHREERLAEQAQEIHRLGRDLHQRLQTMEGHFARLGGSLNRAVETYNRAMGSLDSRVLVAARRFDDLGVDGGELETPPPVELRAVERRAPERRADERRAIPDDDDESPSVAL